MYEGWCGARVRKGLEKVKRSRGAEDGPGEDTKMDLQMDSFQNGSK